MQQYRDIISQLNNSYEDYCERTLTGRYIKHSDINPLIERLKNHPLFLVKQIGVSTQDREIYLISAGNGKKKVFLWSQMHGDESTATMAFFDIFNFFMNENRFEEFKKDILNKLTLYFIPMVNPDGAEVFERRNSTGIDINRDALRLQTAEGRILKDTFDSLKADFGFNLHDQSKYYSAGRNFKSAAISFLAPPFNSDKTVNQVRKRSMQLIGELANILHDFIPGHIGKYSDEYEPRAFGDNFQAQGTSTVLIETGGWKNDPEKQFLRKINFIVLISAFKSIADSNFLKENLRSYKEITLNEEDNIMDLILRNLHYKTGKQDILIDVGINRTEKKTDSGRSLYSEGRVIDMGDLSVYSGYEDYDCSGMEISIGKTFENKVTSAEEVSKFNFPDLISRGYTNLIADFIPEKEFSVFPVNLLLNGKRVKQTIDIEGPANFYISRSGEIKYVIINGFFIEAGNSNLERINGEVIR